MMWVWLRRICAFSLAALIGWAATVWLTPRFILTIAHHRMAGLAGGVNQIAHLPQVTPQNQTIVRPAPDLLYSACAYDLSDGPVAVTVGATPGYWSASFFDAATNNFTTTNSHTYGEGRTQFQLDTKPAPEHDMAYHVVSPTRKGVVLIRRRIASQTQLLKLRQAQAGDACAPAAPPAP